MVLHSTKSLYGLGLGVINHYVMDIKGYSKPYKYQYIVGQMSESKISINLLSYGGIFLYLASSPLH